MESLIRQYFKKRPEIAAVYLFGSRAQGRHADNSDVDLAILTRTEDTDAQSALLERVLVELPREIRKDIHPVILNTAGETLLRQIFSKGRCLLANDPKQLSRFKMEAFVRIAEFGSHLHRMQKGFVRSIMNETHG